MKGEENPGIGTEKSPGLREKPGMRGRNSGNEGKSGNEGGKKSGNEGKAGNWNGFYSQLLIPRKTWSSSSGEGDGIPLSRFFFSGKNLEFPSLGGSSGIVTGWRRHLPMDSGNDSGNSRLLLPPPFPEFFFWDLFSRIFLEKDGFACSAPWNGRESMESVELLESEGALKFSGIWEFPNHSRSLPIPFPFPNFGIPNFPPFHGKSWIRSDLLQNSRECRSRKEAEELQGGGLGPGIPGKTWKKMELFSP